jgi:putative flippase GtrA
VSGTERWLRFNVVGIAGFGVQLLILGLLAGPLGFHYLWATALAVEAAVVHNFAWHEAWTWKDRPARALTVRVKRLLRFHGTNGATSLLGNLALMEALVGQFHWPLLPANLLAVAVCSLLNFLLSHYLVFRSEGDYFLATFNSSTSKSRVAPGGIKPPPAP